MTLINWLVIFIWLFFVLYWAVSARGVKKDSSQIGSWRRSAGLRVAIIVVLITLINFLPSVRQFAGFAGAQKFSVAAQWIGLVLCAAGIAFAVWARRHLGTNWSAVPSIKEGHELVTSGPYRFVRHPIYTGVILALFGSALVGGLPWLMVAVVVGAMFVWRVGVEEKIMMQLFPGEYPVYRKRTKALVPFVW